jgi:hypothetical protein
MKYPMNNLKLIAVFLSVLFLFSSCEDVIVLDLDTTEEQLVIEATLDATAQIAQVVLTRSNDFYDNELPASISGATITLANEKGAVYSLTEIENGRYQAANVLAEPGDSFTVTVDLDEGTYQASSTVPQPVVLEDITVMEDGINSPFGDDEGDIILSAKWNDPPGQVDYYRIRAYVDESMHNGNYMVFTDDIGGDGKPQEIPLRDRFEENTLVEIELLSTSEAYYDYFFQLTSIAGGGPSTTTPFNPVGNFNEGALGYFGIYYTSSITIQL